MTDDGLKELKGFRNLKSLSLFFNGHINDAGMKHVKELPALESLVLNSTGVTDAGIAELKGLVKLKSLSATGCVGMTDKSAETIAGFTELTDLALPFKFTDKGVKQLAGLKKLKSLYLGGCTELTDAAMKDIADNMPDLESLELGATSGTGITNASVLHFSQLKKLKKLGLSGSKMTPDGLKALPRRPSRLRDHQQVTDTDIGRRSFPTAVELWEVLFFSPKGWDSIAQGNALGSQPDRKQPEGLRQKISQAFSLEDQSAHPGGCRGQRCPSPSG